MFTSIATRSLWSLENIPTPNTALYTVAELERLYNLNVAAVAIDGDATALRNIK